ncbi:hypothetical protein [Methylobacterium sp. WL7]|uniref:hypothetical protein n=1 Tax=Methylobacterium sp. WL7 TaxID=2603900 RepID=UPI001FF05233|nr:hypothetical protein [Methylobacterium sp. WL7]
MRHIQERLPGEVPGQTRSVEPAPAALAGIGLDELLGPGRVIQVLGQQRRLTLVVPAAWIEPERELPVRQRASS